MNMTNPLQSGLHRLSHGLRESFSSTPKMISLLLILGIIVMLLIIVITLVGMRRASIPKIPATKVIPPRSSDSPAPPLYRLPPIGGWISEFLARKGVIRVSSLSLSFLKAIEFLRETIGGVNSKYRLPWYLMVGVEGSGKTTLIETCERQLLSQQPDMGHKHPHPECTWWFMRSSVVLDIRGDVFLKGDKSEGDEKSWRSLLILLSRYRSARPLNGIILTIPATELYGRHKLSREHVTDRAQFMAQKLMSAQRSLGLRLPVYIMITKTDSIPGFKSLCSEIPIRNRHNMLGWSSPYTLSTAYTPQWVDEALGFLQEQLNQLRLDVMTNASSSLETRDGIFVFPKEIMGIKENLSIYMDHLFKGDAYEESLVLRGIYLSGDSGMTQMHSLDKESEDAFVLLGKKDHFSLSTGVDTSSTSLETVPLPLFSTLEKRHIFFAEDVLSEKIFREYGLTRPLKGRVLTANRSLNVAKISTAAFVLVGTYGMFHAHDRFSRNRDYILPVLAKMNSVLRQMSQVRLDQPMQSSETFNAYARQLIDMMDQLEDAQFFSVFIPASWFSPLQTELHKTLRISYQHAIVRTVYVDLLLKARSLLYMRPTEKDKSPSLSFLLDPLSSTEYQLFKHYIEGLSELNKRIEQFNALRYSADPKDLSDLITYTFHAQMPERFWNQYKKFRHLLRQTPIPNIDLRPYQEMGRYTLNLLYQHFLNALFSIHEPSSLPARIQLFLQKFSQQSTHSDITILRQFALDLGQSRIRLGESGKTWLDVDIFNPGNEYERLLTEIDHSPLFGTDVTQYLVDQTAIGFGNFKDQMRVFNRFLSEALMITPVAPSIESQIMAPSQGLLLLEKSLSSLFAEPYMAPAAGYRFTPHVPPGKMIYWDANLVQIAYDMTKRYEEFMSKSIGTFPASFQENIRLMARSSLQANIISLLARAQSFVDAPSNLSEGLAAEEILRAKIGDIKEAAPKFIKLLELLNQDDVGFAFVELRALLGTSTHWLLEQVEEMMQSLNPYSIRDVTFDWWDGQKGAALSGYGVRDVEDLKTYVSIQEKHLRTLALDFAKILVEFLDSSVMTESVEDKSLIQRWKRIVESVQAYASHKPGSSMATLNDFILKSLNTFDSDTIFSQIPLDDTRKESGDFFLETIRTLKKGLLSRSEVLKRHKSLESYQKLSRFFNENLRGRFPFSGVNTLKQEASPESLREFYDLFQSFGGSTQTILEQIYPLGPQAFPMVQFLRYMENIFVFFEGYLKGTGDKDLPYIDFNIDFRTNRDREVGADLIVGWEIKPDEDTIINKSDKQRYGRWVYGNPVDVTFRWPEGETIPVTLAKDPNQPFMSVEGRTATFHYPGRWSFLYLLRAQKASGGDYILGKDPNPYVTKFVIPVGSQKQAIAFNVISLMKSSGNPKSPGRVLPLPVFPTEAPSIPVSISSVADRSVLSDGSSKAYSWNQVEEAIRIVAFEAKEDKKLIKAPEVKEDKKEEPKEDKKKEEAGKPKA